MPITRPRASSSGPPELPCVIGASVWIASTTLKREVREGIERRLDETTPTASESVLPNGLPIAATGSPTTTLLESPSGTRREREVGRIQLQDADVVVEVEADDLARRPCRRPRKATYTSLRAALPAAFVITWALVSTYPCGETTNPEPWAA